MAASKHKHSILVVDDEVDNVDALERLFRKKYNVHRATSGAEALEILNQHKVAVIISDQRMPGLSGVELLAKSIELDADTIRILLTGYTDIDSIISAINSGHIYRYVTKPWDPVDLSNAVDKAVDRYEIGHELVQKNQELQLALQELRTLDQSKSQFMILVNHELKTPLTSILSFGDLMAESNLDDDQKLYLNRIRSSAKRLHELVNDVLEFVSAETGSLRLDRKKIKAEQVFNSVPESIEKTAEARQVKFDFRIEPHDISCDERQMRNVFRRLMHNAAKFSFTGSTVKVIGETLEGGSYLLKIENQGPSIDAQRIHQLLKPFTLNENVMNHTSGTGLGWSICQGILKLHGSGLKIDSKGSEIQISFELTPS